MRRAKMRHQVVQERTADTARLLVRYVHVHKTQNKLYSVEIRPLQPKNDHAVDARTAGGADAAHAGSRSFLLRIE